MGTDLFSDCAIRNYTRPDPGPLGPGEGVWGEARASLQEKEAGFEEPVSNPHI